MVRMDQRFVSAVAGVPLVRKIGRVRFWTTPSLMEAFNPARVFLGQRTTASEFARDPADRIPGSDR
jgi:hypothetical protein